MIVWNYPTKTFTEVMIGYHVHITPRQIGLQNFTFSIQDLNVRIRERSERTEVVDVLKLLNEILTFAIAIATPWSL